MQTASQGAQQAVGPDLAAVKRKQNQIWASGDYSAVASRIVPIAESLCDAADLRAGAEVLDVATGSGNAALAAARCGCVVTGIDYVPALLERGRARAAAEGLDVRFLDGDAESLPFPDASFDAVLSVVGVMFAPDQEKAAAELLRVCRPGGTIALASWTPDSFIGDLFRTVGQHVTPPAGVKPPSLWGTEERIQQLLGQGTASLSTRSRTSHVTDSTFQPSRATRSRTSCVLAANVSRPAVESVVMAIVKRSANACATTSTRPRLDVLNVMTRRRMPGCRSSPRRSSKCTMSSSSNWSATRTGNVPNRYATLLSSCSLSSCCASSRWSRCGSPASGSRS